MGEQLLCVTWGWRRMRSGNYWKNRLLPPSRLSSEARLYTTQRNRLCNSIATQSEAEYGQKSKRRDPRTGTVSCLSLSSLTAESSCAPAAELRASLLLLSTLTRTTFLHLQIFTQPNNFICSHSVKMNPKPPMMTQLHSDSPKTCGNVDYEARVRRLYKCSLTPHHQLYQGQSQHHGIGIETSRSTEA